MRAILVFANLILACVIAYCAYGWYNEPSVGAEVATSVSKERKAASPQPKAITQQQAQRQYAGVTPESQIATTVALNIFDPERAPKATVNRRANATPVNRNDMTLAGTFIIGDISGAIIIQRSQQMQMMRAQQAGRNNQNGTQATAEELAAAQATCDEWRPIANMFGDTDGKKVRREIQSYVLMNVLGKANCYLKQLSERYELSCEGLVLSVVDANEGYAVRPVNTLSGGEQFLVSLALALGLAGMNDSGLCVDMLFIDEGFGTLDDGKLDNVIGVLQQLTEGNRLVGVISHVDKLEESIPQKLRVTSGPHGSTLELELS